MPVMQAERNTRAREPWMVNDTNIDRYTNAQYDDDDCIDTPMTDEERERTLRDPEFIAWRDEIYRKLAEADADEEAGRVTPHEESVRNFWLEVRSGII